MNKLKILALVIAFTTIAYAQNFNATGLGLGNNALSFNSGLDAFNLNPANLATNKRVEIKFMSPLIAVSNSSISLSDYNRYFTKEGNNGLWSAADEQAVIDLFPEDGLAINADINMGIFSMVYNNFGFGIDLMVSGGLNVKYRQTLKTVLDGPDFIPDYKFAEPDFLSGSAFSAIKYSFSYAHSIDKKFRAYDIDSITVGAKLSYYAGISVIEVLDSDLLIQNSNKSGTGTENEVLYMKRKIKTRTATPENSLSTGGGFGIDLSASAVYDKDWHFSVLVENLFASIDWDTNTELFESSQKDSVYFYNDDGVDRSSETDTTMATGSFSTPLPVNLVIGAHYQLLDNLTLMAQWKQGLSKNFGNVFTPQIGVGAEYRPISWVPLRSGLTLGGRDAFILALGGGLDFDLFEFNLAYAMREAVWPTSSNGAYLAFDFKFKF
jgi:hypothetical protein